MAFTARETPHRRAQDIWNFVIPSWSRLLCRVLAPRSLLPGDGDHSTPQGVGAIGLGGSRPILPVCGGQPPKNSPPRRVDPAASGRMQSGQGRLHGRCPSGEHRCIFLCLQATRASRSAGGMHGFGRWEVPIAAPRRAASAPGDVPVSRVCEADFGLASFAEEQWSPRRRLPVTQSFTGRPTLTGPAQPVVCPPLITP
jgi:hypothetical protein